MSVKAIMHRDCVTEVASCTAPCSVMITGIANPIGSRDLQVIGNVSADCGSGCMVIATHCHRGSDCCAGGSSRAHELISEPKVSSWVRSGVRSWQMAVCLLSLKAASTGGGCVLIVCVWQRMHLHDGMKFHGMESVMVAHRGKSLQCACVAALQLWQCLAHCGSVCIIHTQPWHACDG